MQVSVENLSALERRMTVHVPQETVEREIEQRLRRVGRKARLKGFRPGKIPMKVIRQHYGDQVRREVLGDLMQSSYTEAISSEKLTPAGQPRIEPGSMEDGADLEYTATFEVYPEIELAPVEGLKIERPVAEIEEGDIDQVLENLREQRAVWVAVERGAAEGDRVVVDFSGRIDGEVFEGGTGEQVAVVIGSGTMLSDFEYGLQDMRAGEQRDVDVGFPEGYPSEELAGRTARFAITAHTVEEKSLPEVDDEFCRSFDVEDGVDALRQGIRENMQREMEDTVRRELRNQVMDRLLANNPLELPGALVAQESANLRQENAQRLGRQADELPMEPFEAAARRRVALGLLIGRLIEECDITVDPARVNARLESMVAAYDRPEQLLRAYRSDAQVMRQIEMTVLEEQALDWLVDNAEVSDKPVSFGELMHPGG